MIPTPLVPSIYRHPSALSLADWWKWGRGSYFFRHWFTRIFTDLNCEGGEYEFARRRRRVQCSKKRQLGRGFRARFQFAPRTLFVLCPDRARALKTAWELKRKIISGEFGDFLIYSDELIMAKKINHRGHGGHREALLFFSVSLCVLCGFSNHSRR